MAEHENVFHMICIFPTIQVISATFKNTLEK